MNINRIIMDFVVFEEDSVLSALNKISANKHGIVFCVDEHGVLTGSISDGDFRRWVLRGHPVDLDRPCAEVANPSPRTAPEGIAATDLAALFTQAVRVLPLVTERGHIVAIATREERALRLGRHLVGPGQPCVLIAEIGINHNGSVDLARHLVDLAADAGADLVKFQLRDLETLYRNGPANLAAGEDLGPQYTLDLLSRFSLGPGELFDVFDHCARRDIDVICTPWD
ncbi:MAG: N-acetylneuraminate synthase family protein, partial [Propionibacteriaceae bacterium]|nr:N-acetylneuraminate synthase family protein [Propionibacteriaceae bacterium]